MRRPVSFLGYTIDLASWTLWFNLILALLMAVAQNQDVNNALQAIGGPVYAWFSSFKEWVLVVGNLILRFKTRTPVIQAREN